MIRHCLSALFVCLGLAACGASGDADEGPLDSELALNEVLNEPQAYDMVSVAGVANPVGDLGFIITQKGVSMFVEAQPSVSSEIEEGEEIRVTASVETFDSETVREIKRATGGDEGVVPPSNVYPRSRARIREGAPYLELVELDRSDG